jgi:hypothetical protein
MYRRNIKSFNREQSSLIFAVFNHKMFNQTQTDATVPLNTFQIFFLLDVTYGKSISCLTYHTIVEHYPLSYCA